MAEKSYPWGGQVLGDAVYAPYDDDEWTDLWRQMFNLDRTIRGIFQGINNELAVTGGAGKVTVASGAAQVDGKFYENSASVDVTIPTPTVSTRNDRIVLRKDFAAQTVRITRIAGVEGAGVPALTQTDGATWDLPLASVAITTGAAITVTDNRYFCRGPIGMSGWGYFYIPGAALKSATTAGAISPVQTEFGTNDIDVMSVGFANSGKTYAVCAGIRMPADWNGGVVYASFDWKHLAAASFGVRWGFQGLSLGNDDAMDAAYGTTQEVTDTGGTTGDLYISGETPAITIAGAPGVNAASRYAIFRVYRDAGHGDDNLNAQADLLGVLVRYGRN